MGHLGVWDVQWYWEVPNTVSFAPLKSRTMTRAKGQCSKCSRMTSEERFRFFELLWKCDLILEKKLWQGILCKNCHEELVQKLITFVSS